ncbi:MAG: hypothetical protein V1688_01035 [bacterium]
MEEENNFQSISNKTPLNIGQKAMAAVLVFSVAIVFFFGIWQFKKTISFPFENVATSQTQTSAGDQQQDSSIIAMQNKDTDGDGLSDYEEIYIYKTSPYLADSDSDNIDDKKEIDTGSNPNCPEGKDCGVASPQEQNDASDNSSTAKDNTATDTFDFSSLNNLSDSGSLSASDLSNLENSASATDLFSDLSVSEIRDLLKESGLPSEVLDQLTDEQILEAYKTTLKNMNEAESPQSP